MNELNQKSATELAELIKSKEVSSKEVVETHLKRIEEVNPEINAITVTLEESATELAKKADNASDDERNRPFHGVPITIKENIDFVGTPTTNGLPFLAESMPPKNTPLVDRMVGAGAIPIGRTNLPEMGLRLDTDNPLRGRTFNPWNKEKTPGGSSGGEGAAIATGMSPFGIGNDIGGSLRNPAYCCGITALKPSIGRIPFVRTIAPFEDKKSIPLSIVLPAFITSELKTAFEIVFLIFLPFLVIDMVIASILMSLGMMMLSPMLISLPFKLLLFVLVDGWAMTIGSLSATFLVN